MNNIFGKRLRSLRREKDVVMVEMAKDVGLTQTTLSKYENGKRIPNIEILERIAQYLDVSADYLIGKTDIREPYYKGTDDYIEGFRKEMAEKGHDISDKSKDEIIRLMIMALKLDDMYKKND